MERLALLEYRQNNIKLPTNSVNQIVEPVWHNVNFLKQRIYGGTKNLLEEACGFVKSSVLAFAQYAIE